MPARESTQVSLAAESNPQHIVVGTFHAQNSAAKIHHQYSDQNKFPLAEHAIRAREFQHR
jgi:hypothetical protein